MIVRYFDNIFKTSIVVDNVYISEKNVHIEIMGIGMLLGNDIPSKENFIYKQDNFPADYFDEAPPFTFLVEDKEDHKTYRVYYDIQSIDDNMAVMSNKINASAAFGGRELGIVFSVLEEGTTRFNGKLIMLVKKDAEEPLSSNLFSLITPYSSDMTLLKMDHSPKCETDIYVMNDNGKTIMSY